jgi:sec-independent protein translocase protein TatA
MGGLGWPEILGILAIVIVIFGVGKIADVGPALGKAIRGFKDAVKDEDEGIQEGIGEEVKVEESKS